MFMREQSLNDKRVEKIKMKIGHVFFEILHD